MAASLIARILGWTGIPQWLLELLVIVLAVLSFALWERHQGAQGCIGADRAAVAKQEQSNADAYARGVTTVFEEASEYDRAIHAPVERPITVRLCQPSHPSAGIKSGAPAAGSNAATGVRNAPAKPSVQRDIGPELLVIARDADAQVSTLQSYIRDVCKPSS